MLMFSASGVLDEIATHWTVDNLPHRSRLSAVTVPRARPHRPYRSVAFWSLFAEELLV
jgi:hypothetical protein